MKTMRAAFLAFLLFIPLSAQSNTENQNASEIIRIAEEKQRGDTAITKIAVKIERPRFTSSILLESWDARIGKKSFIRILEPEKDRGVTFLKMENNLWNFIPKIGREIRIEGSMLQDSWMGSDFSNDDLVRSSSLFTDYTHKYLQLKNDNHVIELTPKPAMPIEWQRVVYTVRQKDYMPVQQDFFDHKNRLRKRMEFSDYEVKSGRLIPTKMRMMTIENNKVKSQTSMLILEASYNVTIPSSIFSKANLRR